MQVPMSLYVCIILEILQQLYNVILRLSKVDSVVIFNILEHPKIVKSRLQ